MVSRASSLLQSTNRIMAMAVGVFIFLTASAIDVRSASAEALVAHVDLSEQTVEIYLDGRHLYTWAVSTGRAGHRTPTGSWHPVRLERDWHSRKYGWAPMPDSVFFYGGYAVHGTTDLANLGQTASHGCVRLAPQNARIFFDLVLATGRADTLIQIVR